MQTETNNTFTSSKKYIFAKLINSKWQHYWQTLLAGNSKPKVCEYIQLYLYAAVVNYSVDIFKLYNLFFLVST